MTVDDRPLELQPHGTTFRDQRIVSDRRRRPTPMVSRYTFTGRRREARREDERSRIYVDRFRAAEWRLALGLVALSGIDMALTLRHLALGGEEANPLMAAVIADGGLRGFVVAKLGLSIVPTTFLLLHVRFPLARTMLKLLVGAYILLIAWHLIVIADRGTL